PQLLDRGENALARGRGDRPGSVVDDIADDGGGRTRQPRHIIPGYLGHARSLRGYIPFGKGAKRVSNSTGKARLCERNAHPCDGHVRDGASVGASAAASSASDGFCRSLRVFASSAARSTFSGVTNR